MSPKTTRERHEVLSEVERAWEKNPHLTLYGLINKLKPENADSLSDERLIREIAKREWS